MIIISDCIKDKTDEGCIKVASSLAKRLGQKGHRVISLGEETSFSDATVKCNKILTNPKLYSVIEKEGGNILYIPFASNTLGTAIRTLVLTKKSKRKVSVLFALRWNMTYITKKLFELSECNVISLCEDSHSYFSSVLSNNCTIIRTGVECSKFIPVDSNRKRELRNKYNIPQDKTVLLHAGHLKHGRNVDAFLSLPDEYYAILIFSSVTDKEEDLRAKLLAKDNIDVREEYYANVEELYQLSDVYVFPVAAENNSIDIPVSVLEAAGCNIRVLATPYKEIRHFEPKNGMLISSYSDDFWNNLEEVMSCNDVNTREIAEKYDWEKSIETISALVD